MSDEKQPSAVIWDMDGVLVDSGDLHYYTWRDVLDEELGFDLSRSRFDALFGHDNRSLLAALIGSEPAAQLYERLAAQKEAAYREGVPRYVRPIEASLALAESLHRRGWPQIVATSAPRENVQAMVAVFPFERWFASYVCVDDVARGKPAPDLFLKAAERLGVPPGRCVVIEDSTAGVQAARSAGMACLALTTTHAAESLRAADRVVESLAAITPGDLATLASQNGHSRERNPST